MSIARVSDPKTTPATAHTVRYHRETCTLPRSESDLTCQILILILTASALPRLRRPHQHANTLIHDSTRAHNTAALKEQGLQQERVRRRGGSLTASEAAASPTYSTNNVSQAQSYTSHASEALEIDQD
jgi:hypothetical protein